MRYNRLILNPKREKSVINRHPWVFSGAVSSVKGKEGEIVEVVSHDKKRLGYGFYSPKGQKSCRMFEWTNEELNFDTADYWIEKVKKAYDLRAQNLNFEETNCYRLLHAEGDFLPGIIVDVYGEVAVAQILHQAIEQRLDFFIEAFKACGIQHVYTKLKTSSQKLEEVSRASGWLYGGCEVPVQVIENGVKFWVDFIEGQKTGFFIDQRDNRKLVGELSKGKKVLNTFSYTGGFSAYAAMNGAREVVSVDLSKSAIEMAEKNVALNNKEMKHTAIAEDCFAYLSEMPQDYFDLVILDPPAFAKHKRALENATRGYKQINLKAFKKIKPGGTLFTFSCSQNITKELFQKIIFSAAAEARRNVRIIHQVHQTFDHPVNIFHPEGEYLKGLVLYVE